MRLSIITINYNNCAGLKKTIDSVVAQTWRDFEWIVIDGGSTDGSKELIEKYQDHFAYWCSEPDKGVYNAMNKGMFRAQGEYISFMNSGDAFHNAYVLSIVFKETLLADILVGSVFCEGENKVINKQVNVDFWRVMAGFCHQGTFVKLGLLRRHPFDENLRIVSDWKFWLQTIVFDNNTSIQWLDIIVADYDMNGVSSDEKNKIIDNLEREQVIDELFPPLIIKELHNYQRLQNSSFVRKLKYMEGNNNVIFSLLNKIIDVSCMFSLKLNKIRRWYR